MMSTKCSKMKKLKQCIRPGASRKEISQDLLVLTCQLQAVLRIVLNLTEIDRPASSYSEDSQTLALWLILTQVKILEIRGERVTAS